MEYKAYTENEERPYAIFVKSKTSNRDLLIGTYFTSNEMQKRFSEIREIWEENSIKFGGVCDMFERLYMAFQVN